MDDLKIELTEVVGVIADANAIVVTIPLDTEQVTEENTEENI
jgi:hypothetical protein